MNCPFCNAEAVRRPKIEHRRTKRAADRLPAIESEVHVPRKGWWCPVCKRCPRGEA